MKVNNSEINWKTSGFNQSTFLLIFIFLFTSIFVPAQGLVREWDKHIGGDGGDRFSAMIFTVDGGYLLGGSSNSNRGAEKSEDCRHYSEDPTSARTPDYWVVKVDKNGNKQWDKTFGGYDTDDLSSIAACPDSGYLLGGRSNSGMSGDKSEGSRDDDDDDDFYKGDYWIVKIDKNGNKQWDKTFGGASSDQLSSILATSDSAYLLAGWSESNSSGDKSEDSRHDNYHISSTDYWVVKIDKNGNKIWDKTFGGYKGDILSSIVASPGGGYLLGGHSDSDISGEKSEDIRATIDDRYFYSWLPDYWLVKIDNNGNKQWDKTIGGPNRDEFSSLINTLDSSYLLVGLSGSTSAGYEKSQLGLGPWVVKIDKNGIKLWDRVIEERFTNKFYTVSTTKDSCFLLGGRGIAKIDADGNLLWSKDFGRVSSDAGIKSIVSEPDGFLFGIRLNTLSLDYRIMKYVIPVKCGPEGCMDFLSGFNPDAGNVQRSIRDLEIWGGTGEEPLVWMRFGNSRFGNFIRNFGNGHHWTHSYQYDITPGLDSAGRKQLLIHYPEGEQNYFVKTDTGWRPAHAGVDKQLFQNGNEFILQKNNGFRYRFLRLKNPGDSIYQVFLPDQDISPGDSIYQLQDFRDSHQNLYQLEYNNDQILSRVTEPAGRYLQIEYNTSNSVKVISKVSTNDGRSVQYNYSDGSLTSVDYGDNTKAEYKYLSGSLLLEHAIDPRHDGSATSIKYNYLNSSGFIKNVKNGVDTTKVLVTLDTTSEIKTLTYANGGKLVYKMLPAEQGQIKSYTDGLGNKIDHEHADLGIGFRKSARDALGRVITYNDRTKYGNPKKITYPDGSTEEWTRDTLDLVLTHTNQLFHTTTFTRDGKHRVVRIDYVDGSYETFSYNDFGQVLNHLRRNGGSEHSTYNSRGLLVSFTDAEANITNYTYDNADRIKTVTDARSNPTTYEYNERGLVSKMINPGGSFQEYRYDNFGNRTSVINELKKTWTTEYDEFRRTKRITDPLQRYTEYSYELAGGGCCSYTEDKPSKIKLPSDKKTTFVYDLEWNVIQETVGAGSSDEANTYYIRNIVGSPVWTIDPRGKGWHRDYDTLNRVESEMDPSFNTTRYLYDAIGRVKKVTRPDNGMITNDYDDINRLTKITDPKNQETKQEYDAEGNLVKLTDPKRNDYVYEYDKLNRKRKMIYPGGSFEKYDYDEVSNLKIYTNRAGNIRTNSYDQRNRLTNSVWGDNLTPAITIIYDDANRVLTQTNSVSALNYTYNDANELENETQAVADASVPKALNDGDNNKALTYSYNEDGLIKSIQYPQGNRVTYAYNATNQMESVIEDGLSKASYSYDLNGNRTGKSLINKTSVKYTYDRADQMINIDNQWDCVSLSRFDYGYDQVNRRTFIQRNSDRGDVYSYDSADQVTNVKYEVINPDGSSGSPVRIVQYDYDAAGNRTSMTDSGTVITYVSNNLNQYTRVGEDSLEYLSNGNLKTVDGWSYTYDALNRLTKAEKGSTIAEFGYDAINRCIKRTINGTTTFLYYDAWSLIEERNASDVLLARYIHGGETDEILAKISASDTVYYHHDALGNVVALTNSAGHVIEQYAYDIFGTPTIKDGSGNNITSSAFGNRFLFTGREYVTEIGLYDYRNRIYSPKLGRFLQTDPIGFNAGDANLYRYVANNTVNQRDPSGEGVSVISTKVFYANGEKILVTVAEGDINGRNVRVVTYTTFGMDNSGFRYVKDEYSNTILLGQNSKVAGYIPGSGPETYPKTGFEDYEETQPTWNDSYLKSLALQYQAAKTSYDYLNKEVPGTPFISTLSTILGGLALKKYKDVPFSINLGKILRFAVTTSRIVTIARIATLGQVMFYGATGAAIGTAVGHAVNATWWSQVRPYYKFRWQ